MQRTFLRSDSNDLIRLQTFLNSTATNSLRHEFKTVGIVSRLVDELEKAKKEQRQLLDRNKYLEETLNQTNHQLQSARERIDQLIVENQNLPKATVQRTLSFNCSQWNKSKRQSQLQKPQMTTKSQILKKEDITDNLADEQISQGKGRKRSAENCVDNGGIENDDVFAQAAKRLLLRKTSVREENNQQKKYTHNSNTTIDDQGQSTNNAYHSTKENAPEKISAANVIKNDRKSRPFPEYARPRRSMSVEPVKMQTINSNIMHTQQQQKQRQSRMLATLKNSRISCSHGDLSRAAIQQEDTLCVTQEDDDGNLNSDDHSQHTFRTKRNFLRIQCGKCDLPIRFGVLYVKCQQCKATFHEPCRIQAPLPCVFRKITPSRPIGMNQRYRLRLGDYCADTRPMVPSLITYCCFHLDNHPALPFDDIYQMDGDALEVESITKLFQSTKSFPKLEIYHPVNIAGCIKKFLAQIREPVIGQSYGKEIVKCLSNPETIQNLQACVEELPIAHIDTLGHLCRHWRRLIAKSNDQITVAKLSEYVAPLVFGTTRTDSSLSNNTVIQAMGPLIQLPLDYWTNLANSPGTSRSNTPNLGRNPSQRSNHGNQNSLRAITTPTRQLNFQPQVAFDSNETENIR